MKPHVSGNRRLDGWRLRHLIFSALGMVRRTSVRLVRSKYGVIWRVPLLLLVSPAKNSLYGVQGRPPMPRPDERMYGVAITVSHS